MDLVQGTKLSVWVKLDGAEAYRCEPVGDDYQFAFGGGSLDLVFTRDSLRKMVEAGAEALNTADAS